MSETNGDVTVEEAPERRPKGKRGGPFARLALFLRQVVAEMRKVVWPGRRQLLTYTGVVIVFVCVIMAFVSVLDLGFGKLVFWTFT